MKNGIVQMMLWQPSGSNGPISKYEPISSVWERNDGELLEAMLAFYSCIKPEPILDATYNAGRFWEGSSREVVSIDTFRFVLSIKK